MFFISHRRAPFGVSFIAAAVALSLASPAFSQTQAAPAKPIEPIIVTGNPFGSRAPGQPDSVLTGDALAEKLRATLGETLAQLPGISSSYFGPTSSRPIIRGLDGERIRVLENGAASTDAASLSPDHAVPIDPIALSRIEVLRGPAALLYGSNAVGGVVNAVSDRIPRAAQIGNAALINFGAESGDSGRNVAARLDGLRNGWALHVDGTYRKSSDTKTPRFTLPDGETRDRIDNSASRTQSGALGFSRVWQGGFLGASVDGYESRYGIVASDGVTINMKREKVMIEGETELNHSLFSQIKGHLPWTNYKHDEVEPTGQIGTRFSSRALQWRLEGKTQRFGAWQSVVGASGEHSKFTAVGEEAFVPPNTSNNAALFGLARAQFGATELNAGARVERSTLRSEVVFDEDGALRFGEAQRRALTLMSTSASLAHDWKNGWTTRAGVATTERAPTYFERFANGVHIATNAVEVGDVNLGKERATHVELGVAWKQLQNRVQLNTYVTRFRNFISLEATGEIVSFEDDESFPIYAFRAVPAQLVGAEIEGNWRLLSGATTVDVFGKWDVVRATNRATREPLARIAPMRASIGTTFALSDWRFTAETLHVWKQTRVPESERLAAAASASDGSTPGHTLLNASISRGFALGAYAGKLTLRGTNLTSALAFNASSIQTIRERAPLPGRSVLFSVEIAL
jgi:iron complex outermembrane recepter protein